MMRIEIFSVTGWGRNEDAAVHEDKTADLGAFDADVVPLVGDLVEWETAADGNLMFWTAVVQRRAFHFDVHRGERMITCRLAVALCDELGGIFTDEDVAE
jgi:hypothetical protein